MPEVKSESTTTLEKTVLSGINALWNQSISQRGSSSSVEVYKELYALVNGAIQSLGARENARLLVNQLPTELFAYIASYLGTRDLFRAALVCKTWRAVLLGMPRLWTRICISLRHCTLRSVTQSAALLETMLARSHDLALCIEFQCLEIATIYADSEVQAYGGIPGLIAAQMPRVRSLALLVPTAEHTPFRQLIETPAPILTSFVLYVPGEEFDLLPDCLFAGHAPCLTRLTLRGVDLHSDLSYPAVRSVEELVYDAHIICMSDVTTVAKTFLALRALTLVGDECELDDSPTICTRPVALRLPCIQDIPNVIASFPNATSVCLSASVTRCADDALDAAFRAAEPLTTLDVDYRRMHWPDRWETQSRALALILNGRAVVVDLGTTRAEPALRALAARAGTARSIAVGEEYWPLFAAAPLPALRELTLRIMPLHEIWSAERLLYQSPHRALPLELLRLVVPPEGLMWGVEEDAVVRVVRALADPAALRALVLCGASLVVRHANGTMRELFPHLEIVFEEWSDSQDSESPPWFWAFPTDEAIHI